MVIVRGVMGSGDGYLINNQRHHLHGRGECKKDQHQQQQLHIPKGCLAVMVGKEGEGQQRFVVPVAYLSHPRFVQLLKDAEDEYGFDHKGAIAIPCHVADFHSVHGLIDCELFTSPHHHFHHLHRNVLVGCFRT